ncbi:MAG: hypothetical protein GY851_16265 [bacterium]|nr:hypothetical protein [bacterium]
MNILLVDADTKGRRSGFPNLALMKLAAWHRARGDAVTLAPTPWFSSQVDLAYVSSVFSWNRAHAEALAQRYPTVERGGTGFGLDNALPAEVEAICPDYNLYDIDYGMGFLTRGCPRRCSFCVVPRKEGAPRVVAGLDDIINPHSNFVVLLDNNFLAMPDWALATLREMAARGLVVNFSQGLDIRLVTPEIARALAAVNFRNARNTRKRLTVAFDHVELERMFRRGVGFLMDAGIAPTYLQAYVLCGHDTTFEEDMHRVRILQDLGIDPYVMVYRDPASGEKNPDWRLRHFARWVNARLWRSVPWGEYRPWLRDKSNYLRSVA